MRICADVVASFRSSIAGYTARAVLPPPLAPTDSAARGRFVWEDCPPSEKAVRFNKIRYSLVG